jgi:hypothetical protein
MQDFSKGILLFIASALVSLGAANLVNSLWLGVALMLIGGGVYVARELLKKYVDPNIGGKK